MVEQDVSFDAAFGAAELGPGEQSEAQRDGGRIQQLVLEAKCVSAGAQVLLVAKARQRGPEQIFEQGGRTVLVGVRQRRSSGCLSDAEMHQPAQTTGHAIADLAQRIGASELAKEHGYELRPATKSLGGAFGAVFLNQSGELGAGEMLEQLI